MALPWMPGSHKKARLADTNSLILGFSSSMSSFCHTLFNEDMQEVNSMNGRLVYKSLGEVRAPQSLISLVFVGGTLRYQDWISYYSSYSA